ncbi:hypothetical protein GOODEAATRI_020481, partial [Goodea atripinnis]
DLISELLEVLEAVLMFDPLKMIMVSMCFQRKSKVHYHVAVIINYLGHCISLGALLLAFTLFMRLRSIRCLRNIIHWNLISAFILRNGTWFIVQLTMKPSINFVFLFNIVRILMTKLRASTTSETIQYRKAVKATLVLLPLLGITYMLFFVNPGGEDEVAQIVFIYFNSILESFQGFFVSVFYCFLNMKKRWMRWHDRHSIRSRTVRATSLPTSPSRVSFHSIKQSSNL